MKRTAPHLVFALELAALATHEILPRRHRPTARPKPDGSPVTAADRAAETAMRRAIRKTYPAHGIVGEEQPAEGPDREWQWVLDPLDGTRWFALGVPLYGVLIALLRQGAAQLGVMHLPAEGATLHAQLDGGCWYRTARDRAPRRVRTAARCRGLADARVSFADLGKREVDDPRTLAGVARVVSAARDSQWLGGCIQHMLVARGLIDVAIDTFSYPWDSAPVVACVREAGGVVSTLEGDEDNAIHGGSLVSSANRRVHEEVLAALHHRRRTRPRSRPAP